MAAKRRNGPPYRGTISFTCPKLHADVWDDDGENYICVEGTGASDPNDGPYATVAVALFTDDECPALPGTFPGTDSIDPPVYTCDVNSDGSFEYPYFVPGAISSIHPTGAPQMIAIWGQYGPDSADPGTWTDCLYCMEFDGEVASETDCGTSPPALRRGRRRLPLKITAPDEDLPACVIVRNKEQFICVRGYRAFNPQGGLALAVAAKVFGPGKHIPRNPPLHDPDTRIVNVTNGGFFAFDRLATLLPAPNAVLGTSGTPNTLAVWPQYTHRSWGGKKLVSFFCKKVHKKKNLLLSRKKEPCVPCDERRKKKRNHR